MLMVVWDLLGGFSIVLGHTPKFPKPQHTGFWFMGGMTLPIVTLRLLLSYEDTRDSVCE